jgi:hypothetical protein
MKGEIFLNVILYRVQDIILCLHLGLVIGRASNISYGRERIIIAQELLSYLGRWLIFELLDLKRLIMIIDSPIEIAENQHYRVLDNASLLFCLHLYLIFPIVT